MNEGFLQEQQASIQKFANDAMDVISVGGDQFYSAFANETLFLQMQNTLGTVSRDGLASRGFDGVYLETRKYSPVGVLMISLDDEQTIVTVEDLVIPAAYATNAFEAGKKTGTHMTVWALENGIHVHRHIYVYGVPKPNFFAVVTHTLDDAGEVQGLIRQEFNISA